MGYAWRATEDQKTDLKLFQDVKGGKVLLCWIVSNVGDQLTPKGKTATDYWITEKGGGNFLEGVKAYANAICDTIEKYNLDGFDIDYEPYYGGSGNLATALQSYEDGGETYHYDWKKYPAADYVGAEADIIEPLRSAISVCTPLSRRSMIVFTPRAESSSSTVSLISSLPSL